MPADAAAEEYDHLPGASVSAIAETVGFDNLPDEVARALAPDVEYRLREVIQDACKFMRHSKRVQLSTEDVNSSLKMKKVEALYGFPANAPAIAFKEVPGHPDFFTQASKEIELKDILAMKLPRPPIAVNVVPHWLAVDGVQPLIPENPPLGPGENLRPDLEADIDVDERARAMFRAPVAPQDVGGPAAHAAANAAAAGAKRKAAGGAGEDGGVTGAGADGAAVVQPVVAHELSKELQLYFDRVTAVIRGGGAGEEAPMLRAALASLATDAGLHQLMPYLVQFVQTEVAKSLRELPKLRALTAATLAIVANPNVHVELYLHQFMPSIVTCMVAKRLCASPDENHWALREQAAETMNFVCEKFGREYPTIQPRITRTLSKALLDETKPLSTHYGAIVGLHALGPRVVRMLLVPNIRRYMSRLEPFLEPPTGSGGGADEEKKTHASKTLKYNEAVKVKDALRRAVGLCLKKLVADPRREAANAREPELRAARLKASRAAGDGGEGGETEAEDQRAGVDAKKSARDLKGKPASEVEGFVVGKAPKGLKVEKAADADDGDGGDGGELIEDPRAIHAELAAAAALLGDDVGPYAPAPAVADTFL